MVEEILLDLGTRVMTSVASSAATDAIKTLSKKIWNALISSSELKDVHQNKQKLAERAFKLSALIANKDAKAIKLNEMIKKIDEELASLLSSHNTDKHTEKLIKLIESCKKEYQDVYDRMESQPVNTQSEAYKDMESKIDLRVGQINFGGTNFYMNGTSTVNINDNSSNINGNTIVISGNNPSNFLNQIG